MLVSTLILYELIFGKIRKIKYFSTYKSHQERGYNQNRSLSQSEVSRSGLRLGNTKPENRKKVKFETYLLAGVYEQQGHYH